MVVLPPVNEPAELNDNYILYWNSVALDLNRLVATIAGPQNAPPAAARALGILHLAINDAYFAIHDDPINTTYLKPDSSDPDTRLPPVMGAADARQAVAGAANTVLLQQYTTPSPTVATATTLRLSQFLQDAAAAFPSLDTLSSSYRFGVAVGTAMLNLLAIRPSEPGFDQDGYRPTPGRFKFDDDPTNPVRIVPVDINNPSGPKRAVRIYVAPFYGMTAKRLAIQGIVNNAPVEHINADPPTAPSGPEAAEYASAFDDVYRQGGATALNTTRRTPAQTATGLFWAYDGSNLIGTPPRLFNQILRKLAWSRKPAIYATSEKNNADFARLFAFFNVALADAGIQSWQEKYCYEFWRPLSGVREDGGPMADPFWLVLGAPETNSNEVPFKPPFPAYPSGHATFAGAGFQAARLYYRRRDNLSFAPDEPDEIGFDFVSEELDGVSRDLREPYDPDRPITEQLGTVRTRIERHYPSLWAAMFDTGVSRVFLGVHWRFDAFASEDVLESTTVNADGTTAYKMPEDVLYRTLKPRADRPGQLFPVGGVPLGIGIANDIFQSNLIPASAAVQPNGRNKCGPGSFSGGPAPGSGGPQQEVLSLESGA